MKEGFLEETTIEIILKKKKKKVAFDHWKLEWLQTQWIETRDDSLLKI